MIRRSPAEVGSTVGPDPEIRVALDNVLALATLDRSSLAFHESRRDAFTVPFELVRGGGMTARCWDRLVPLLRSPAHVIDLPGRGQGATDLASISVADFVHTVVDEIVGQDLTEVILVGHSLAGITLPGVVGAVLERLRRLVFVAASVPPDGFSVETMLGSLSPTLADLVERRGAPVDSAGRLHPDFAKALFCNDQDAECTRFVLDGLVPEAPGVISEPIDLGGLGAEVPRTYVRLLRDASLLTAAQDEMVHNMGGAEVIDLDAGHMAMVSRPAELAALLNSM